MKKIIKYVIKIFTKVIILFLSSINSGRYLIDELNKNIIKKSNEFIPVRIDVDKQKDIAEEYNGNARKYGGIGIPNILFLDKEVIEKKLLSQKKFVWLKRNISPKEHQKIIELGEIHLRTLLETKRIYPFQNIGAHVLGYVDIDNKGQAGIERGLDDILNKGENIFLTIDINLQNAVQEELESTIEKFSADSGVSLLIDIKNGEIISLNNFPFS